VRSMPGRTQSRKMDYCSDTTDLESTMLVRFAHAEGRMMQWSAR